MMWAYNEEFNDVVISKSNVAKAAQRQVCFFMKAILPKHYRLSIVSRQTYLGIREPYRFDDAPKMVAGDEEVKEEKKQETKDGF